MWNCFRFFDLLLLQFDKLLLLVDFFHYFLNIALFYYVWYQSDVETHHEWSNDDLIQSKSTLYLQLIILYKLALNPMSQEHSFFLNLAFKYWLNLRLKHTPSFMWHLYLKCAVVKVTVFLINELYSSTCKTENSMQKKLFILHSFEN